MTMFLVAFLIFGLGAFLGGALNDDIVEGSEPVSWPGRLLCIPLVPWFFIFTLFVMGVPEAIIAVRNAVHIILTGNGR